MIGYPALVDQETTVAVKILESRAAADVASRAGLRRLFLLQMSTPLHKLEHRVSAAIATGPLARRDGVPIRTQIVLRAFDEAFGLTDPAHYPRSRKDFLTRLDSGKVDLGTRLTVLSKLAEEIGAELGRVEQTLRALNGKPGAPRTALAEMRAQVDQLTPSGFLTRERIERLAHYPRYLRAILLRLERMPNGPQKDQSKAEQVVPLWNAWLQQHEKLRARGVSAEDLDTYRWLIEELRVSLFAPELKAAVPVSPQKLADLWKTLAR
jgi:ATP-dependent helicase HrpA